MALKAEIGDIVTWTEPDGRVHIGRVAAAIEVPPAYEPPAMVSVATPEGDYRVVTKRLRVVRPNFVQETWNNLGHAGQNPWHEP